MKSPPLPFEQRGLAAAVSAEQRVYLPLAQRKRGGFEALAELLPAEHPIRGALPISARIYALSGASDEIPPLTVREGKNSPLMPKYSAHSAARRRISPPSSPILSSPKAASCHTLSVTVCARDFGIAVLAAEHRLEELLPISDRVIVMDNGKITADCDPRAPSCHTLSVTVCASGF